MSAPKHTPGPWVVRPGICRNDHPDTSADVHGPQGQFVADCGCHEQATANATLAAAAPELLQLLTEAIAMMPLGTEQRANWITRAWDARRKAEGRP